MILSNSAKYFFADTRLLMLTLALILVAGLSSFAVLPRMEDPLLARRVSIIHTRLPGSNAERVESLVTEKIEDQLRDIEEIKEVRSFSRAGISAIAIELRDQVTQTDTVWSRIRSRLEDSIAELPPEASRPVLDELQVRAYALIIGLTWQKTSPSTGQPTDLRLLRRLAIDLQDRLQNVSGTELVDRFGDPGEEILVKVDPSIAASMGLTVAEVASRIAGHDAKTSAGQIRSDPMEMLVEVGNQFNAVDELASIPIVQSAGRDAQLSDLAQISMEIPHPMPRAAMLDGHDAVVLGTMVRPEVRLDQWTRRAEAMLAEFEKTLPRNVQLDTMLRQSDYVNTRLTSLSINLLAGVVAVTIVVWLMMGLRSAIIVTLTLPLASLMVLFGLRVLGIGLHQMSITGLIIALGLLIDNSIVIVDEVKSRLRSGMSAAQAMVDTVQQLAVPLFGSTLTTALAFAPIALMPGPAGEFVSSIAISVILAIFSSLFLALTVIPTMAAKFMDRKIDRRDSSIGNRWLVWQDGVVLPAMTQSFESFLRACLKRPWLGVLVSLLLPVAGFIGAATLQEQFFPPSGRNQFYITIEGPATSTLNQTRATTAQVDTLARSFGARRTDWFFGESAPQFYYNVISSRRGTANYAQGLITLNAGVNPEATIAALQQALDRQILSSRVLVRQLEQGPPFESPVEIRLFGPDIGVLRDLGDDLRRRLSAIPEVIAVRSDLAEVLPQLSIQINEGAAVRAGISPSAVAQQFATSLLGSSGGSVLQDNEQLPVLVRVGDRDRESLAQLQSMNVMLPNQAQVEAGVVRSTPLSAIANVTLLPESAAIPRLNRRRMNEINGYLRAGVLASVVQTKLEDSLQKEPLSLPEGYSIEFGGEASKRNDAVGNLMSTVGVLTVLMIATLVLSFGSFRWAALIALVAVLSVGLGLGSLALSGHPFGFTAIIGTMGLIGVAINDSIVILAAIQANPLARMGDLDAKVIEIMHSSRHVVATTLTTVVGFAPLILDGGGFWPPMAVSIAGGVSGATFLALILVPTLHQVGTQYVEQNIPV